MQSDTYCRVDALLHMDSSYFNYALYDLVPKGGCRCKPMIISLFWFYAVHYFLVWVDDDLGEVG